MWSSPKQLKHFPTRSGGTEDGGGGGGGGGDDCSAHSCLRDRTSTKSSASTRGPRGCAPGGGDGTTATPPAQRGPVAGGAAGRPPPAFARRREGGGADAVVTAAACPGPPRGSGDGPRRISRRKLGNGGGNERGEHGVVTETGAAAERGCAQAPGCRPPASAPRRWGRGSEHAAPGSKSPRRRSPRPQILELSGEGNGGVGLCRARLHSRHLHNWGQTGPEGSPSPLRNRARSRACSRDERQTVGAWRL
jgi:hypothetical protein